MALSPNPPQDLPKATQSPEAQFREVLEDVVEVCDALAPYVNGSTTSLVEVLRLAGTSDHQLNLLHNLVIARQAARR